MVPENFWIIYYRNEERDHTILYYMYYKEEEALDFLSRLGGEQSGYFLVEYVRKEEKK